MKRHSTDVVSLVFGLVFIAIAGWWLAARFVDVDWNVPNLGWIAAGALILLGLVGIVSSLRGGEKPSAPALEPTNEDSPYDEAEPSNAAMTTDGHAPAP